MSAFEANTHFHHPAQPAAELVSTGQEHDFVRIGQRLAEHLHAEHISRIVFLDGGARQTYVSLNEAWKRLYPAEPKPAIFFINPLGFNTQESLNDQLQIGPHTVIRGDVLEEKNFPFELNFRPAAAVQQEFRARYPGLVADLNSPLMIFDTCQHSGLSTEPVFRCLIELGFQDVRLGLASNVNDLADQQPDFVALANEAHGRCYPYQKETLVFKTAGSVTSTAVVNPEIAGQGRLNRRYIQRIFEAKWNSLVLRAADPVLPLEHFGFPNQSEVARPAGTDLFYADGQLSTTLPPEVATHPELLAQAAERRELHRSLAAIFAKLPVGMEWSTAIDRGLINQAEVQTVYHQLANFLTTDSHHARLCLYLPLEMFLPAEQVDPEVRYTFEGAWLQLLNETEQRANYVDGDIAELELGRGVPPTVRKAAHLAGQLLAKGWLSREVVDQVLTFDDDELHQSLVEGLQTGVIESPITQSDFDLDLFLTQLQTQLNDHHQLYQPDSPFVSKMIPSRYIWEKLDRYEKILTQHAEQLAPELPTLDTHLLQLDPTTQPLVAAALNRILVKAIFITTEKLAKADLQQGQQFFGQFQNFTEIAWQTEDVKLKNDLYSGWAHLTHLGILAENYLPSFGLKLPDLSQPFPLNLKKLASQDLQNLKPALELIHDDPEVAKVFYPLFVLSGSKVKGYDTLSSDLDILSFRNVDQTNTAADKLAAATQHDKVFGFAVKETPTEARVVMTDQSNDLTPLHIQSLLGSVWVGDRAKLRKIRQTMVRRYTDLSRFGDKKDQVRFELLRRLELDTLQARLLHRGYRFFHPDLVPADIKQNTAIDGDSAFWDPGFRQVASLLFLSRVFLPDLS